MILLNLKFNFELIIFTKIFLHHHKHFLYALKFSSKTIRAYLNRPRAILVTIVISRRIKAGELTFSGWLLSFFSSPSPLVILTPHRCFYTRSYFQSGLSLTMILILLPFPRARSSRLYA